MHKVNRFMLALALFALPAFGDTPAPSTVKAKVFSGDGVQAIGYTGDSLNVDVTNPISCSLSTDLLNPAYTQSVFGGVVVDPRARSWTLGSGTDSVLAMQGGAPWTFSNPAGACTAANQSTGNSSLASILAALQAPLTVNVASGPSSQNVTVSNPTTNYATETGGNLAAINTKLTTTANGLKVDASGVVMPVSGTVNVGNFPASSTVKITDTSGLTLGSSSGSLNVAVTNGASMNPSVSTTGTSVPAYAVMAGGRDTSGNLQALALNSSNALRVDGSGTTQPVSGSVSVSNFPTTQPVSAASLPLPSGAATAARQDTGNASLASIDSKLSGGIAVSGAVNQGLPGPAASPWPVSVQNAIPLPAGASTSALQTTGNSSLSSIDGKLVTTANGVKVDIGSATISGNVSVSNFPATQAVSAASLPLPSGAATEATLSSLNSKVTAVDTGNVTVASSALPAGAATSAKQPALGTAGAPSTDVLTVQGSSGMTALKVDGSGATQPISGSVSVSNFPATQAVSAASLPLPSGASTEATLSALNAKVTAVNTGNVTVSSSALPSGAATAANQTTANSSLSSIVSNTTGLALESGGHLASVDSKITTTANGVKVDGSAVTQPVSAASLPLPTGAATESTLASLNSKVTAVNTGNVTVSSSALPSGASTSALQTTGNSSLSSIDTKTPALVSGRVPVDGSGVTQPISAASLPLPTGAATSANQTTANASLSSIDAKLTNGTQKAQLVDSTGAAVGPLVSSGGINGLPIVMAGTNYVFSAVNSTTTQLAAGATFTGAPDNTLNQPAYSILITTDQPGTLQLFNCIDAACTRQIQLPNYSVGTGGIQISNVLQGNYWYLKFTNNGASATTTLNINTYFGTIDATTNLNNKPMALNEIGGTAITPTVVAGTPYLNVKALQRGSYANIALLGTTVIKSGAGTLKAVCLNTNANNGNTLTLFDNTAGTGAKIALVTTSGGSVPGNCGQYNAAFSTGLTAVATGASDWTVVYE